MRTVVKFIAAIAIIAGVAAYLTHRNAMRVRPVAVLVTCNGIVGCPTFMMH